MEDRAKAKACKKHLWYYLGRGVGKAGIRTETLYLFRCLECKKERRIRGHGLRLFRRHNEIANAE